MSAHTLAPVAAIIDPDTAGTIHEIVAYHTDDAGQTFITAILDNGDVIDADALDAFCYAPSASPFAAAA